MHTHEVSSSNVPAFLIKLWKLVEDPLCDELIAWSDSGVSFIIKDQAKFASELLPQYFKHNNMASFVRQLNMYGFRKVMHYEKSGLRNENNEMEFQHPFFVKEQSELLELIKRKIPNTRIISEPNAKSDAKDILTDLTSIRDKQENMDNMLVKMKQENELLWKELTNMRQKHKQQEEVIEKVIHFLVQVIRNQPVGVGIQRQLPRMLHDSPGSKGNTSKITTLDVLRKKPECIIVKGKSPSGPVIHEITEFDIEEPHSVSSVGSTTTSAKSPAASKLSVQSPGSINSLSPATQTNENEQVDNNTLNTLSLSGTPLEPLCILEPLQTSRQSLNEDNDEDSILDLPLEFITTDVDAFNAIPPNDTINISKKNTVGNVISIPEGNNISNVLSIPEGSDISNVISIPEGSDINNVISIPEGSDINQVIGLPEESNISMIATSGNKSTKNTIPSSKVSNVIRIPNIAVKNASSNKTLTLTDIYDPTICLDGIKTSSASNVQNSANLTLSKHDYIDSLMSDSLHTPKVNLTEDIDIVDFTVGDSKKYQNTNANEVASSIHVTQQEHNYPASMSNTNPMKSSATKNVMSNHILTVDEDMHRLKNNIASTNWHDVDKLLGLFSSDGIVGSDSFVDQLTGGISIKKEPEDILSSELGQLTPQILGVELDELRTPYLDPDVINCDNLDIDVDKNNTLLEDDNINVDDLDVADFLNNEGITDSSPGVRRKNYKIPKGKRRKLK